MLNLHIRDLDPWFGSFRGNHQKMGPLFLVPLYTNKLRPTFPQQVDYALRTSRASFLLSVEHMPPCRKPQLRDRQAGIQLTSVHRVLTHGLSHGSREKYLFFWVVWSKKGLFWFEQRFYRLGASNYFLSPWNLQRENKVMSLEMNKLSGTSSGSMSDL